MRKIYRIINNNKSAFLAVLCLLCSLVSVAQITVDKAVGCAPHTAIFGAPGGSSNHLWDFGDGAFANTAAPSHIFTNPGIYTVKYTGTAGAFQKVITVQPKPTAVFGAVPTSGCIPLAVQFTDQSVGAGGTAITGWQWTFGDGGSAGTKNPLYTYTLIGSFSASLIATDANGCKDDTTWVVPIVTSNTPPIANFTPSVTQSCTAPLTVSFINNSSAGKGGALSYLWDFGNGTTSVLTTPNPVTYNATGVYTVKLTVTELNGCISSKSTAIVVSKPIASFTLLNDTVCPGIATTFTNTSLGAVSYSWDFGDAGTSNQTNPSHTYNAPGTYNVKLTASAGGCSDDTTFALVVENVVANFTRVPSYYCDFPMQVKYTNTSIPAGVSWLWEFGDQKTAVTQNPTHNFLKPDDSEYTVYDPLFFANKLTVTSAVGCKANVTKTDTINPIIARLQPDTAEGCVPLKVQFSDSSRSKELINFYHWDFGDGQSSAVKNPSHTYNTTGDYTVFLDIKNVAGCADTSYPIIIRVGDVTAPDFSVSSATVCPNQSVILTDLTPGANVDSWHYTADGANASDCPSDSNWTWKFNSKAGAQDITLTTGFNGCYSSKTISNAITVKGPIARLNYTALCDSPYKYIFKGEISGADSWTWDFGDGQTIAASIDTTVTHYYVASGNYKVKIIGTNATSGCADYTDSVTVKVRNVKAVITTVPVICKQISHTFSAASSVDVYSACSNGYRWDWGDGSPPSLNNVPSDAHTYASIGIDTIRLIVSAENGCKDTATFSLKVFGIKAGFTLDNTSRCIPFPVNFNDTTHSDTTVVGWAWTFGNGLTGNTKSPSTVYGSKLGNPWTVKMVVTDKLGCQDSTTKTITPFLPNPSFGAKNTLCTKEVDNFTGAGTNISQYTWDFGDGTPLVTKLTNTATHAYTNAPGPYSVKLVVKDINGCLDSITNTDYILVQSYPKAGFTSNADSSANLCYPFKAAFYDTTKAASTTSIVSWDVGTGDPVLAQTPVKFTYGQKGTYKVTLVSQTSYGCKDTASRSFKIVGPEADFSISDTLICIGDKVNFTIKDTVDVNSWDWDFGGTVVNNGSPVSNAFNFYPPGGINIVSLTAYTAGKTCSHVTKHNVRLHEAHANFGIQDSTLCLGDKLTVTDSSGGADSWQWVVAGPSAQTTNTPTFTPVALAPVGNYTLSLRISDQIFGCKDTMTKKLVVNPLPDYTTKDVALCKGSSKLLSATNKVSYTYSWTPPATLATANQASTLASPLATTVYTITVTDTNSCVLAKTITATVYEQTFFNIDTSCAIIGETVDIGVDMGDGYTYDWTTGSTKNLSCTDCATPSLKVMEDGIYKLLIKDTLNCFVSTKEYNICVLKKFTVDVPSAFTPNADGIDDLAFVKGWGIDKLIVFRIFNRWGELVFESSDINQGWDGTYKGQPQNMESYVYYAEVLFYSGQNGSKTGSITIIR